MNSDKKQEEEIKKVASLTFVGNGQNSGGRIFSKAEVMLIEDLGLLRSQFKQTEDLIIERIRRYNPKFENQNHE